MSNTHILVLDKILSPGCKVEVERLPVYARRGTSAGKVTTKVIGSVKVGRARLVTFKGGKSTAIFELSGNDYDGWYLNSYQPALRYMILSISPEKKAS